MDENKITTRQVMAFTVVLSFIVSVIGTVLTFSVLGLGFTMGDIGGGTIHINRPGILEKIVQNDISERVLRQDDLVVKVVEVASPAVVSVVATKDVPVVEQYFVDPFGSDPFFRQFFGGDGGLKIPQYRERGTRKQEISSGTGFIVSADGLIVTNKHVVADPDASYTVLMNDGRKLPANVLARDPLQDLAVIKISGSNFPYLKLGDSSKVKIGQTAIAIGNALGEFKNTVSVGVISGLHRSVVANGGASGPEALQELIQTDAAINPGNSGGPLLNVSGEVIGIDTAMAQGAENIGFAIPINKAKKALDNVRLHGRIIYPFIGVRYIVVTKDLVEKEKLARDYGVYLQSSSNDPAVVPGSPAQKSGLLEGDIILQINGEKITPDSTLSALIQKYNVGEQIMLNVFRRDHEFEVKITLEERKQE